MTWDGGRQLESAIDVNSNQPSSLLSDDGRLLTGMSVSDGAHVDAFGRLRVSQPISLFNHQNLYGVDGDIFETVASGAGATVTYLPNENSDSLAVGTVSGEYTIRQTFRYFPYTPGKSQLIILTAVFGAGVTNITKRIGYFDNSNGLFFEQAGAALKVVKRSFTSGAAVDTAVAQASWNLDKLDGTGNSGVTLDVTKTQILVIDFQWLGVGRVRFGFCVNGITYYCHEMLHANLTTEVYMTSPALPVRYEIRNTGTSVGGTLKQICASVSSEGGMIPEGEQFAAGNGTTSRTATTTRAPMFAIRMAATINGKVNRRTAKLLHTHIRAATNDALIEIVHGHLPTSITATWTSAGSDSGIEYSKDISVATFTDSHTMAFFSVVTSVGQGGEEFTETSDVNNEHDRIYLDYAGTTSTYLVVYATAYAVTSQISASMGWIEY